MDSIQINYKPDKDIKKELAYVDLDYFLEFDYTGKFEFLKCAHCDGPQLGHLEVKCPRLEFEEKIVKKYEKHLRNFQELRDAFKRKRSEVMQPQNTRITTEATQLVK